MNQKFIRLSCAILLFIAAAPFAALPAQAGFEWLPDGQTPYADAQTKKPTMSLPGSSPMVSGGRDLTPRAPTNGVATNAGMGNGMGHGTVNTAVNNNNNGGAGIFLPLPGQFQGGPSGSTVMPSPRASSPAITRAAPRPNPAPHTQQFDPAFKMTMPSSRTSSAPAMRGMTIRDNFATPNAAAVSGGGALTASTSTTRAPSDVGRFPIAEGFGSEIPLAMALRQVVPADYAYAFGNGVNPGYRVSWNGGQPWNDVVFAMINPLDLVAYVRGKKLFISKRTTPNEQSMIVSTASTRASSSLSSPASAPMAAIPALPSPAGAPTPPPMMPMTSMTGMNGQMPIYSQNNLNNAALPQIQPQSQSGSATLKGPENQDGFVSLGGGRSNILDPGLNKRPQAAKTVSKIKQWTKLDILTKDKKNAVNGSSANTKYRATFPH